MNEVQELILRRAMQKVASRGLNKEAGVTDWFKNKYEQATDWLARKIAPTPSRQQGQVYTTEDPGKPFSNDTPLLRKDDDKTTRQSTLGDRRDWLVGKGIRQGIQDYKNGTPVDTYSSRPVTDTDGVRYYGPAGKLEWLNKKYGGNAQYEDIASQGLPFGSGTFKRPVGVYLPKQMTSKQMYYAPYLDFFDASDDYKVFNQRLNKPMENATEVIKYWPKELLHGPFDIHTSARKPKNSSAYFETDNRAYISPKDKLIRLYPFSSIYTILHELGHGATLPLSRLLSGGVGKVPIIPKLTNVENAGGLTDEDIASSLGGKVQLSPEDVKVYGKDYGPLFTYYQDIDEAVNAIHNHNVHEKNKAYIKKNNLKDVVAPGYSNAYQQIVDQLDAYQKRIAELSKDPKADKQIINRLIQEHNQLVNMYNSVGGNFNLIK